MLGTKILCFCHLLCKITLPSYQTLSFWTVSVFWASICSYIYCTCIFSVFLPIYKFSKPSKPLYNTTKDFTKNRTFFKSRRKLWSAVYFCDICIIGLLPDFTLTVDLTKFKLAHLSNKFLKYSVDTRHKYSYWRIAWIKKIYYQSVTFFLC